MIHTPRSILGIPAFYKAFGFLIGGNSSQTQFAQNYVKASLGNKILDIGCGPGDLITYFPNTDYTGFDISAAYITAAQAKYGHLGQFFCKDVAELYSDQIACYDIVLAVGVIHHLDDSKALHLFDLAHSFLKPGGKLVTFDGVFVEDQSAIARYIIAQDRGQYVRTKEGYLSIASQVFSDIKVSIRHDLLRIPYTHLILECFK